MPHSPDPVAIEQSWQQSGGSESQNLHDVWVSEEEASVADGKASTGDTGFAQW